MIVGLVEKGPWRRQLLVVLTKLANSRVFLLLQCRKMNLHVGSCTRRKQRSSVPKTSMRTKSKQSRPRRLCFIKEAKALAENGAPEAMVKGIRERAAAIVETMETMETGAVEGDPNI
jgi:hypothetical protein